MRLTISRLATGVAAILLALATVSVSTAYAEEYFEEYGDGYEDPISTACGGGTKEHCGDKPITVCEWDIGLVFNPVTRQFEFKFGKRNCKITGKTPIYKDIVEVDPKIFECRQIDPLLSFPSGVCRTE